MPEWSAQVIELGIELRRINGMIAARTKAWVSIPPPATSQAPQRIDQAALNEFWKEATASTKGRHSGSARCLRARGRKWKWPSRLRLGLNLRSDETVVSRRLWHGGKPR